MKRKIKEAVEKRSIELIVLASIIVIGGVAASASSIIDAGASTEDGLVAEYRFDTGAGNTAYSSLDSKGSPLEGSVSWGKGVKEKSVKFDGGDGRVDLGNSGDVSGDEITISFWSYWEDAGDQDHPIISKNPSNNWEPGNGYVVGTGWGEDFRVGIGSNLVNIGSQSGIEEGKWQHYVVTYKDGEGMKLYLNGKLQYSDTGFSGNVGSTSQNPWVGDAVRGGNWKGRIDEVKIYARQLNQKEIDSIYNSGAWRTGYSNEERDLSKVLDLSFQHQNSTHVFDTSGYSNHGQRMNDISQENSASCKVGRCYSFDGTDDVVSIDHDESYSFDGDFSISFWVNGGGTWNDYDRIFEKNSGSGIRMWERNSGKITLSPVDEASDVWYWLKTDNVNDGKWHHVTYTVDRDGESVVYQDGREVGRTSTPTGVLENTQSLFIGGRNGGAEFNGKLDQVGIYNRSLAKEEVWKLYTEGRDRSSSNRMAGPVGRWRFDDAAVYTQNFIPNGDFTGGADIPSEYGSNPTNKIVKLENPGNSNWVLRQNGSNTEYEVHFESGTSIEANTTYVMSSWVAYTGNWDGGDQIFHARWYDGDGNSYTSGGAGHLIETKDVGGLTWEHRYETITTPSTVNGNFNWYWGYRPDNTAGYRYLTNAQIEPKKYATEFVDGTRQERVPDSAENNGGQMGASQTFDSKDPKVVEGKIGDALEFDGANESVEINNGYGYSDMTFATWVKADDLSDGWILNKFADKGDGWGLKAGSGGVAIYDDIDGVDNTYYQTDLDGSWHHIAISMEEGENHLYVDGKRQGSGETSSSTLSSFSGSLYIAQRGTDANYFEGKIDDVRVYPYALTREQVKRVMNSGSVAIE